MFLQEANEKQQKNIVEWKFFIFNGCRLHNNVKLVDLMLIL